LQIIFATIKINYKLMQTSKTYYLSLFFILFSYINTYSQEVGKKVVETSYLRPSVSFLFFESGGSREKFVVDKMKTSVIDSKFDDHRIESQNFNLNNLIQGPATPSANATPSEWLVYKTKSRIADSLRKAQISDYVKSYTNLVFAKWMNRGSDGKMNFELIAQRGEYTATDADALSAKSSAVDRRAELGEKLISKTYIFVWRIKSIQTMEEKYDAQDEAGKNKKDYKPVKRIYEGYSVGYSVDVYKIDFNDSVASVFYKDFWTDNSSFDRQKAEKWKSFLCPINYVAYTSGEVGATQPIDPRYYTLTRKKRLSMDELLLKSSERIFSNASFRLSKKVEDFRVKAPIFQINPISAKLGKKEGLYYEQRFYAYEISLDSNRNQIKNRVGVLRVKKIAVNDSIASGRSKPSIFRQQGGQSLYSGILLESKEDFGLSLNVGYVFSQNNSLGGFDIGLDYLISKRRKYFHGLYFGLGLTMNSFNNLSPGDIYLNYDSTKTQLTTNEKEWSGSTLNLYVNLTKNIYFTRKGNIYLSPSIGVGINSLSFEKYKGELLSEVIDGFDEKDNPYNLSTFFIQYKLGLGFNIHPNVSFEIQPGIISANRYTSSYNDLEYTLSQKSSNSDISKGWGFDNLSNKSLLYSMGLVLKIRI